MMVIVFFLLVVAVFAYIAVPMFGSVYWPTLGESRLSGILREKKKGIWAISDVDNELRTGKLTEADHAEIRTYFKDQLMEVMRQEKDLVQDVQIKPERPVRPALMKKLLSEAIRVCGIRQS